MAITYIPSIFSVFITIGFFAIVFGLIFWGIRKINKNISDKRLRRKLTAASMAGTTKEE
ncbi:MAG: hypothetical protein ACFFDS_05745 [Candidatus Thorarchaeota archaeon]